MYYIYHIPGIKIGCTNNLKRRMAQQGFTNYQLLEQHTDIDIASNRELELQNQYGYKEAGNTNYKQHIQFAKAGAIACKGKPNKGAQYQIENKIGMFGFSKEKRLEINKKAAIIGGKIAGEKRSKPIIAYDYITGEKIDEYKSRKEASIKLNASTGNILGVLKGKRNHTKGYTFKYK